jgi:hypothetical protein
VVKKIYRENHEKNYKYLFLIIYCRTIFELSYNAKISYTKPEYAVKEAIGEGSSWYIFLQSLDTNDFVYLGNI